MPVALQRQDIAVFVVTGHLFCIAACTVGESSQTVKAVVSVLERKKAILTCKI
ncbi:zinc-finger domain-containing protein [Bacteroides sp. AF29-11]|nr:zinc-finger domain-containing protein [Bacteroides sp. AF29-11]